MVANYAKSTAEGKKSWRSSPDAFLPDQDFFKSGFINMSPAWYPSAHSVCNVTVKIVSFTDLDVEPKLRSRNN